MVTQANPLPNVKMANDTVQNEEVTPLPSSTKELDAATELTRVQKQLEKLVFLFNVALNNMERGLSVFDSDQRLTLCNKRYAEIFDLPEELTRPGTPFTSIARHAMGQASGDASEGTVGQGDWIASHVNKLARGEADSYAQPLKNGWVVHVTSQPLSGGGWVDIQDNAVERRKGEQRIKWLGHADPLTAVASPLYFDEELENAIRQLKLGVAFALHWIDLDRFSAINDKFGRPIGDAVLRSVAERLVNVVRQNDLVARLGGDEFAIIQAGANTQAEAERLTVRLRRAISDPYHVLGHEISITASIGVVLAPENGTHSLELIKNVYLALYAAKAGGRDTHTVFDKARHDGPDKSQDIAPS